MKVEVFDPPMCCSSGVCGPMVDPVLPRFAADLEWLKKQGIVIKRYNLAQQPLAFAENDAVKTALSEDDNCLPLVLVDGQIVSRGRYMTRGELAVSICITMRARNESPRDLAPALAELADRHAPNGAFATSAPQCCCGPRTVGRKGASCCG
ncbi:MAG: arsenical resistance operon transcriptional repressor ArsD [Verrucomicrobia bacterium]|nr:arsenical resistance operon transcriptional repressor ArsD [Verrucomicrobiota bacterium]